MLEIFRKFHIDRTDNTAIQFYRYFFVGGISFVVDFLILYLLTDHAGIYYVLSASISFSLGSILNYVLSIAWIFPNRNIKNKTIEFWSFFGIGVTGLILNALIVFTLGHYFKVYYLLSKIVSAFIIFSWNFAFRKIFLFTVQSASVGSEPAEREGA